MTKIENLESIMKHGLRPNGMNFIYLSPKTRQKVIETRLKNDEVLLLVDTETRPLGYFDKESKKWERLCETKTPIPPGKLTILKQDK